MKTMVLFFGRANPPHMGHGLAFKKVLEIAKNNSADHVIYITKTIDKKKNPLTVNRKIFWLRKMFGSKINFVPAPGSFIDAIKEQNGKYSDLIVVAGADRIPEYQKLLDRYNGTKEFSFEKILVVSAGARDPDAEGTSGLSATKMRAAAVSGDIETISRGTGLNTKDSEQLAKEIRAGLGLNESRLSFRQWISEMLSH